MRGTHSILMGNEAVSRITPAHAGNTVMPEIVKTEFWDHPRACGEHPVLKVSVISPVGSPPRMRGTHKERVLRSQIDRITPAHAGNTL